MDDPITLPFWLTTLLSIVLVLVITVWWHVIRRKWNDRPAIPRRRRRRVPWGMDGAALAGLFLIGAWMSLSSATIEETAISVAGKESVEEVSAPVVTLFDVVTQASLFAFFAALAIGWLAFNYPVTKITWGDFGLGGSPERNVRDFGLGILAAAGMLPFVYATNALLVFWLGPPTIHPAIQNLMTDPAWETVFAAALLAVVLAPLFEELAFRVLLQGWLERLTSRRAWWPIFASAICFGIAHTNQGFAQTPIIVLAIGLGYVYRQTHSYVAVVSMHMAFNALSLAIALGSGEAMEG